MYAQRIREIRKQKGFSIRKLALLVGMHETNVSQLENNKRENVTVKTLERFAHALGVSISDFFNDTKEIR